MASGLAAIMRQICDLSGAVVRPKVKLDFVSMASWPPCARMWPTMAKATVGIRELKDSASAIIDRVEEGEAITVTKRGRPVARIVSAGTPPHLAALVAEGAVRPSERARYLPKPTKLQRCRQERCGLRRRGPALSLYLDTSALVKLLVAEPGTEEAQQAYNDADGVRTTAIAHVEATAALARMRKGGRLTPGNYAAGSMTWRSLWRGLYVHAVSETARTGRRNRPRPFTARLRRRPPRGRPLLRRR